MRRSNHTHVFAALVISMTLITTSCTIGPSQRPSLAVSGGTPPQTSHTATPPTSTMPLGPGGPGRTADPIRWKPCLPSVPTTADEAITFTVQCATVTVPIAYQEQDRGTLHLALAEARGSNTPADAPPLVVMLGDPGELDHTQVANIAASLPVSVLDHYTIVTLDPRGTGASSGVDCVMDPVAHAIVGMGADPTTASGSDQLASIARQLTFDCGDTVGPALTRLNSTSAADDLDTIRAALGIPTLALVARGASATIGAIYADRYPARIGKAVLDSPADPLSAPQDWAASAATAAQTLLVDFAAACPQFDDGCPLGADPIGAITDVVHRYASSGVDAGEWIVTGGSILLALLTLLPDRSSWPQLATSLADVRAGRGEPLADLLTDSLGGAQLTQQLSAQIIYDCSDTTQRLDAQHIADAIDGARATAPLFGPFTLALAGLCSAWPAPDEPVGRLSATGAAPIVVIGSVNNPLHPYPAAHAVAGQLESAVLVSWQSGSSGAYPKSSCVADTVNAYLLDGEVPERGVLCPP